MKIENHKVVKMEYTLTNEGGETLDTSVGREPLEYVQGVGAIIPGLEKAMEGKIVGDKFKVEIAPNDGYGERNDAMIQEIPKDQFGETEVAVGMQFQVMTGQGAHVVTVVAVEGETVMVDGNHPMAGQTLFFEVEVKEVRDATEEELAKFTQSDEGCKPSDCGSCGGGCH